ncbi:nuclease, partial [Staphylococcus chromogenes]
MMKIAVLVDGGYYRKRSQNVFGKVTAKERANELYKYCNRHLKETHFGKDKYA